MKTSPNHHWGNVPGSFFYSGVPHRPSPRCRPEYMTKSVLINNWGDIGGIHHMTCSLAWTFSGRSTLSFHHPKLFFIGLNRLDSPACPEQPRGLKGSGNELSHPCRENLQTLESRICTSCWTEWINKQQYLTQISKLHKIERQFDFFSQHTRFL